MTAYRPRGFALALAAALAFASPAFAADSLSGAYLAAQQAESRGDVRAAARFFEDALRLDRGNPALMERAVLNMLADGRIGDAAPVAALLVESAPKHRVGNLALAVESIAEGRFDGALARLRADPEAFYPLIGRLLEAWAADGAGDLAAAEAALDALEGRAVFDLFGAYHRGLIRHRRGDAAGAVEAFEQAIERMEGPTTRVALAYGAALEAVGRVEDARTLYRDAGARGVGEPALEAALARLEAGGAPAPLVETARVGAGEALFGVASVFANESGRRIALVYARLGAALSPENAAAWLLVAQLHEQNGRHELALAAYEAAPQDGPHAVRVAAGRARALEALERIEAAGEALRALVAAEPGSVEAHVALADHLRRAERWEEAASAYSDALDLMTAAGRETWTLHYHLGVAYERAGVWDRAEPEFRRALELEPEQPLVLNYLGYSLVEQRRNLDEAKGMIERAVELRPEDGYITDSLGWVLYRLDDFEGAVTWLERAVELAPYDPVINDHLGDAYWMVGRRLEAEFQWKRARSLDPDDDVRERIGRKLSVGLDAVLAAEAEEQAAEAAAETAPNGG